MRGKLLKWLSLVVVLLPSRIKLMVYRRVYRYSIGRDVYIGLSWIWVGRLQLGDNVQIGHFNRFKNIPAVEIGDYTVIGTGNTFTSSSEFTNDVAMRARGNKPILIIGEHILMFKTGLKSVRTLPLQERDLTSSHTTLMLFQVLNLRNRSASASTVLSARVLVLPLVHGLLIIAL